MNWNPLTWNWPSFKGAPSAPRDFAQSWLPKINWLESLTPRTAKECINLFRDTAYFCANLNARGVARTELCMYRKTGVGMTVGKNARRLKKSPRDRYVKTKLVKSGYVGDDDEVDEIVGHPFLELLERPFYADGVAMMGRYALIEVTQLYLEIVGRAYWEMDLNGEGPPSQIFPLIAHECEAYKSPGSTKFIDAYRYYGAGVMREIPTTEVVPFLCRSLTNPYTGGYSPMMAAGDRVGVSLSYLGQTQAFLDNRARPDMVLAPKHADGIFSNATIQRIWKKLKGEHSRFKVGNPLILSEPTEMIPLQFALKDLGELQDEQTARDQIARAFDVPLSMLDKDANLASASEGRKQHADMALEPRCQRIESAINLNIMTRYDKSGRTFVQFGEPYNEPLSPTPPDVVSLVNAKVFMPDEAREMFGWGPMSEEDKALIEQQRQEAMAAAKPPAKPMPSKAVEEYRRMIRNGEAINYAERN